MSAEVTQAGSAMSEKEELLLLVRSLKQRLNEVVDPITGTGIVLSGQAGEQGAVMRRTFYETLSLDEVRSSLGDCRRCGLQETRRNIVFGEGNPRASLVFVGEAPGEEDRQGRPFVGRAGSLLTRIIEAMNMTREDVYICNILKCRPPGNRNPLQEEIDCCEPFLADQLRAVRPQVICALGTFAAQTLLKNNRPITAMRGTFHAYEGIPLMPTYHPAYLLRNNGAKKLVWDDMQQVMAKMKQGSS